MYHYANQMTGAFLPGGRRVAMQRIAVAEPSHRQVLIQMKASSICGSDIAISTVSERQLSLGNILPQTKFGLTTLTTLTTLASL